MSSDAVTRLAAAMPFPPSPQHARQAAARILAADPTLAADLELGAAWRAVEGALPEGWRPVAVGPIDRSIYNEEPGGWIATTMSPAFFDGDDDDEYAQGYGDAPAAALRALAERLAQR